MEDNWAVAEIRTLPRATPNDVIAAFSNSLSPDSRLNQASSRQTKRGSPSSSSRDRGSNPSLRESEKRSSALADEEVSASTPPQWPSCLDGGGAETKVSQTLSQPRGVFH